MNRHLPEWVREVLAVLVALATLLVLVVCLSVFPFEWVAVSAVVFAFLAIVVAAAVGDEDNIFQGFLTWLTDDFGDY